MRTKEITFTLTKDSSTLFRRPFASKTDLDLTSVATLRHILSKEKSRILHTIKQQNPQSIYDLAKKLNRNPITVLEDVHQLEHFGMIKLIEDKTTNRKKLRPVLILDALKITLQL